MSLYRHTEKLSGQTASMSHDRTPREARIQSLFERIVSTEAFPSDQFFLVIISGYMLLFLSDHVGGWRKFIKNDVCQIILPWDGN